MSEIKIRDNVTGEVFKYGKNGHHALSISEDGKCLYFENLQNGDGSLGGGYSFVLDDGKTPEESSSQDAVYGMTYANIGGFESTDNDGWIPCSERMPEENAVNPITRDAYVYPVTVELGGVTDVRYYSFWKGHWYNRGPKVMDELVIAWRPLSEPYHPERNEGE